MLTNVRTLDLNNLDNVKSAVEHVGLYVGLVVFTAAGAKVIKNISLFQNFYVIDFIKLM